MISKNMQTGITSGATAIYMSCPRYLHLLRMENQNPGFVPRKRSFIYFKGVTRISIYKIHLFKLKTKSKN